MFEEEYEEGSDSERVERKNDGSGERGNFSVLLFNLEEYSFLFLVCLVRWLRILKDEDDVEFEVYVKVSSVMDEIESLSLSR
jgi:hypothetical protein